MAGRQPRLRRIMTLKDVAREAGVSIATVSYSLNGGGTIGAEVREHVKQVADRIGYRPNRSAQAVRTGRTKSIGLLLPDLRNPFFPELAQSVEHAARRAGYTVVLIDALGSPDQELDGLRLLERQGVDGIVWCQTSSQSAVVDAYDGPMVVIGPPNATYDSVSADDEQGGRMTARHLLAHGRRTIGVISGAGVALAKNDRRRGLIAELDGKGDMLWEVQTPYSIDLDENVLPLLSKRDVSAIVCGNDLIAIAVLRALKQIGIRVPDDVAVVGFDDIPWSAIVTPALTTVRQPVAEMGAAAVDLLIERLASPDRPFRHLTMDVSLTERDTVAGPLSQPQ